MTSLSKRMIQGALIIGLTACAWSAVAAEGEEETGWKDAAELGAVLTRGNAENTTFGFKNKLWRGWDKSTLTFKLGGVQTESTTFTRTAIGTPDNIIETESTTTTAENYYANVRYDRKIHERLFWFTGAGWDRNEFAGVQNRYIGEAGVGNIWHDEEDLKFSTAYGVTFTKQEDVVELPGADDTFVGARGSWAYLHKLTETTTYINDLVLDLNVDDTDDWRADMINELAVAMSKRMALKLTLQFLYDNSPSFQLLDIQMPVDPLVTTVPFELDELDTIFTASLVINF